ncbi:MAG: hypothetical protein LBU24_03900 [Methanocalculaceae archaeon]|jgi:phenylacetate-CoA ligase|nr:hypothetical protein [Methanocalculaceae archaeon]
MHANQDSLRIDAFGAEAWSKNMHRNLENRLNIKAHDNYGMSERFYPGVAFGCLEQNGMHI